MRNKSFQIYFQTKDPALRCGRIEHFQVCARRILCPDYSFLKAVRRWIFPLSDDKNILLIKKHFKRIPEYLPYLICNKKFLTVLKKRPETVFCFSSRQNSSAGFSIKPFMPAEQVLPCFKVTVLILRCFFRVLCR